MPKMIYLVSLIAALGLASMRLRCPGCNTEADKTADASNARQEGSDEAERDLAAGRIKLKEYPPTPTSAVQGEYIKLLKERCDVGYEYPDLPQGVSEKDFVQEIQGYNGVMKGAIAKKFGAGIFKELHEEAEKRWQERIKAAGKK